jgi:hypothetical protein
MSQDAAPAPRSTTPTAGARGTSAWVGWIAFSGMILIMLGTFHIIEGIVALVDNGYFLVTRTGLAVNIDYTVWGWVHIVAGVVVLLAGVGVFAAKLWARIVGTTVAAVSALLNVAFLAAYPIWSTLMIALAVVVIMALTVHGTDIKAGD